MAPLYCKNKCKNMIKHLTQDVYCLQYLRWTSQSSVSVNWSTFSSQCYLFLQLSSAIQQNHLCLCSKPEIHQVSHMPNKRQTSALKQKNVDPLLTLSDHPPDLWVSPFELKTGTPITLGLGNVYANFGIPEPFWVRSLYRRDRQTDRWARHVLQPIIMDAQKSDLVYFIVFILI